jgi:tight adherence protein B
MRDEILAATAQSRASSLIITLLPLAAAAGLYLLVPDYFRPMFSSALGWVMIGISAGMLVIGNVIIRRITKIS